MDIFQFEDDLSVGGIKMGKKKFIVNTQVDTHKSEQADSVDELKKELSPGG